ncbi:hypothetical protein LTR08_000417 [Meristemomyces frigidus]|nr:hypothetical protein LTR08_000417 [Meristemomyces frigidus]
MSQPQASQRQATPAELNRYTSTFHDVALLAAIACPVLALLPPRKLDIFTVVLVGTTVYSGNYLVREQSGRSIWQHVRGGRREPLLHEQQTSLPIPPTEQANLSKELQHARHETQRTHIKGSEGGRTVTEELQATQSQRDAWKAQREKEIQDDLDVGKGFGEMITDQIWEVWNWGKGRDDEDD